jgi:hypothetical protein
MAAGVSQLYRRYRFGEPIVVVSGLPRSGTSMIMKMLEAGGMPLVMDGIRTADEDNPKGYYEYERVKKLAKEEDKSWLAETRGKVIKIISYLLKDLPPTNNYQILFVRRNIQEILASQSKMLTRRGEVSSTSDDQMREHFENDLWKAKYLIQNGPQFEMLEIHYKDVLEHALDQAHRINAFLGGKLDTEEMAKVVDQQLYRNRFEDPGRS